MADFDFRDLTDDEDDSFGEFSFDDNDDYGQEIGLEDDFDDELNEPGPVNKFINDILGTLNAQQRMILSMMFFGNVLILSFGLLLVTNRLG